jgi:hypothetical protein
VLDETKPHMGRIEGWRKFHPPGCRGLGYLIEGESLDHPYYKGEGFHTSWVVAVDGAEVETRNSRYTLVGEEVP